MQSVNSYTELSENLKKQERAFVLLYKKGSDQSDCALINLEKAEQNMKSSSVVFTVDVTVVRDIHERYEITTVPSLLVFEKAEFANVIKGCHEHGFFSSLFENAVYQAKTTEEGRTIKNVTVYSTPSCSWCTTLKNWLRKNGIHYTDVDVSRDERSARELVNKSGHQGVPQTEINGEIVVGFDQPKLKRLLEIK